MMPTRSILHRIIAITLCCCFLLLTGCWDRREIEERTSVVGIAIDKSKENPKHVRVAVQIPIPIKIAGSGGSKGGQGGKEAVKIMSADGKTVVDAFRNLQKRLNQELFYGHTRVIAIGEDLARDGVNQIFDPFRRDPQIRRLLWPIVVKGEALELLKASESLEQIPIVFVMTMIENGAKTGRLPDMNLGKFYIDLSSTSREPYLNYMEVHKDDIQWKGAAVFRRDKMVGNITQQDTWALLRISERQGGGPITFNYRGQPDRMLTINTEYIKKKNELAYSNNRIVVRSRIFLEGNLLEKTFDSNLFKESEIKQVEQDAEKFLENEAKQLIRKLQKDYKADILGIGSRIRSYKPDVWKQLNWDEEFPNADIQVTFDLRLRNMGMETR